MSLNSLDVIKLEMEGYNDSIIKQAIGKDPFLPSSRPVDNPVQWIQLLHAMDQPGGSKLFNGTGTESSAAGKGQPLALCHGENNESNKVKEYGFGLKDKGIMGGDGTGSTTEQIQSLKIPEAIVAFAQAAARVNGEPEKYLPGWPLLSPPRVQIQKCKKCSREFCSSINYRRHMRIHRRLLNKDFARNRELLGAFWDKLSLDEAKEIVSLASVLLEEVTGSSIIRALSSWIGKPGFSSLPHTYAKAGATLLDLCQARPSVFPIPSQYLFGVLDDASEKTFLCAGSAVSLQKFVFDGQIGNTALEMKNLVACVSFLLEQQLVKAWLADKDAEALRCHKMLMEEEEAAQKRLSELLEKKRLKKLRQKAQKVKDLTAAVHGTDSPATADSNCDPTGTLDLRKSLSYFHASESLVEPRELAMDDPAMDVKLRLHLRMDNATQSVDQEEVKAVNDNQGTVSGCFSLSELESTNCGDSSLAQIPAIKSSLLMKPNTCREGKAISTAIGHKIWARKSRLENGDEDSCSTGNKSGDNIDSSKVLIGSISVTVGDSNDYQQKLLKPDVRLKNINTSQRQWMPVGLRDVGDSPDLNKKKSSVGGLPSESASCVSTNASYLASDETSNSDSQLCDELYMSVIEDSSVPFLSSIRAAEAFLAERWKEAVAADHVKLLLADAGKFDHHDISTGTLLYSGKDNCAAETRIPGKGSIQSISIASRSKFRSSPEAFCKLKYVPKQTTNFKD